MYKRRYLHTKVAPFKDRKAAWQNAVESAEQHVKLGLTLQGQVLETLKSKQDADPASMAKLIQQATATIEKGVKLERDARDKLIELYQEQPREK